MKKIKTLLPVLLTATSVATVGITASCSSKGDLGIRMFDLSNLMENGWTRLTSIHAEEKVSDFTQWYLNEVKLNRSILRDDVMVDAFGDKDRPINNLEGDFEATGQVGLEIGVIDIQNERVSCSFGFNGNLKNYYVPYVPVVWEKPGYIWGNVSVKIVAKNIGVSVYKTPFPVAGSRYRIESRYFMDDDTGAKKHDGKRADLNKLIADKAWSVSFRFSINGGFSETEGVEPAEEKLYNQNVTFDNVWVNNHRTATYLQDWANFAAAPTVRNLEYMDLIDKED